MPDITPVRTFLNAAYDWPNQDLPTLSQFTREALLPFAGPAPRITASLVRNTVPATRQVHSSIDSWSTALSDAWESFALDIYSTDSSRHAGFEFNLKDQKIRASLDIIGPDTQPLQAILIHLQQALSLGEAIPPPPPIKPFVPTAPKAIMPKERLEGRYHVENPSDVAWFQQLLAILEEWTGERTYFNGSYSRLSAPQFRNSPSQYAEWKAQCIANWKDILDFNCTANGELHECNIRYYVNRADLNIGLSSTEAAELAPLFAVLQKQLPLIPSRDAVFPESRKGEKRRYFAAQAIDLDWFERCTSMIRSLSKDRASFQGRFRVIGSAGEDFSRTNYETWRNEVTARWNDLASVYFWLSTPELTITTDLDLLRDLVSLDLQSPAEDTITATFATLERSLSLTRIERQEDPYRRQRFLRTFNIRRWTTNKEFAEALQSAIDVVFPGRIAARRLAVITSYIVVGQTEEDLENFGSNYRAFYDRLASPDPFTTAELVLEGPQGRTLGVLVNRRTGVLTLRTSIERADLDALTRPFRNAMPLTPKESKDEPEKKDSGSERISKTSILTTSISVLCVLITGSTAILTSQHGLSSLYKHYGLQITYPLSQGGTPVKLPGTQLRIEWTLTGSNITGDHADTHSPASISVLRDGETNPAITQSSDGTAVVPLAPGSYYVKVVSNIDPSTQASINVIVPEKPSPNPAEALPSKSPGKPPSKPAR